MSALEKHIANYYAELPTRLQFTADYVVTHNIDVATRSLRYVSEQAGVAPSTLTRLAQALEFESYEALRDLCRQSIQTETSMSKRAERLRSEANQDNVPSFLTRQLDACINNMHALKSDMTEAKLTECVTVLAEARNVLLYGAFSSTGISEYFNYLASFVAPNWKLAGRLGANLSTTLADLSQSDAMVIITHAPFARKALAAAELAAQQKAFVLVITNNPSCPALQHARVGFVVPSEGPHFFSSYAATIALIETIIGMLAALETSKSHERIALIENQGRTLQEFWEDKPE